MLHIAQFEGLLALLKRLGAQPLQWIPAADLSLEQSVRVKIIKASTSLSAKSMWEPSLRMLLRCQSATPRNYARAAPAESFAGPMTAGWRTRGSCPRTTTFGCAVNAQRISSATFKDLLKRVGRLV